MQDFIVISRCLRICRKGQDGFIFHFKGFFMGDNVKHIKVIALSREDFIVGEDYLLSLKLISIVNGVINGELLRFKKLDSIDW